jgi:hypothetical protein
MGSVSYHLAVRVCYQKIASSSQFVIRCSDYLIVVAAPSLKGNAKQFFGVLDQERGESRRSHSGGPPIVLSVISTAMWDEGTFPPFEGFMSHDR